MNSLIFYGFIAYLIIKRSRHWSRYAAAALTGALVMLIGLSRIYLGVHYASDVLAAFMIGLGWLALAAKISDRFL
mgnify:CR=1 FL=1